MKFGMSQLLRENFPLGRRIDKNDRSRGESRYPYSDRVLRLDIKGENMVSTKVYQNEVGGRMGEIMR